MCAMNIEKLAPLAGEIRWAVRAFFLWFGATAGEGLRLSGSRIQLGTGSCWRLMKQGWD